MHRKERQVYPDEGYPKMGFTPELGVLMSGHLADPIIEACEDCEHRSQRQHIMKMRNHIVRVVHDLVDSGTGHDNAGHAADRKHYDEAHRPEHRRLELDRATPHGGYP